ncbi:MAG: anaerobic ribonucleoside-triphosphate reductase activating protein [Syntrophales bacterium]|nr:anaerobic ribonucleoside-triphosphate reductase activating protein [Syntrophales bacterium]
MEQGQEGRVQSSKGIRVLKIKIGGLQKFSLIDYPGRICAIIFTQGCNFRCPYCHNPELVDPQRYGPVFSEKDVLCFLEKRKGRLDAVSVTGGEPTLQPDLENFLQKVKELGYLVKLDTNGSNPEVIEKLIKRRLVDFWAMDVKGPLDKYRRIAGVDVNPGKIQKSIALIIAAGAEHEFRTTVVRSLLDHDDLVRVVNLIKGARFYVLQGFVPSKTLNSDFLTKKTYLSEEFSAFKKEFESEELRVIIR